MTHTKCAACNDIHHNDDFTPNDWSHSDDVQEWFSGPVCNHCMDEYVVCDCGTVTKRDLAYSDGEGGYTVDPPYCADDYGDWLYERAKDRRMEMDQ